MMEECAIKWMEDAQRSKTLSCRYREILVTLMSDQSHRYYEMRT